MRLSRDQILRVDGRKAKDLTVPELGGEIRIMGLSAGVSLKLRNLDPEKDLHEMARLAFSSCILDDAGEALGDEGAEMLISRCSNETLGLIVNEIMALAGRKPLKAASGAESAEAPPGNPSVAAESGSSPSA